MLIFAAASLVVALAPQTPVNRVDPRWTQVIPRSNVLHGRQGDLVLPARRPTLRSEPQDPVRNRGVAGDFVAEVYDLRRSLHVAASESHAIVQRIGRSFDRVPERCLELCRTADPDVVHGAMRVLVAFGGPEHARELEFLLLTRRFRSATADVVETMAELGREDARDHLFSCLTASRAAVRHHAAAALESRVRAEDADHLVLLSREESGDVQIKAIRLLGFVPSTPAVRSRLIAALSETPQLANAAVGTLVQLGPEHASDLQDVLRRPAFDRSTGYAALALAIIEGDHPEVELVGDDMVENLVEELDVPDPFQRVAVALALAGLAWRSDDVSGERYHDRELVGALLEVVAPTAFISHLATLREMARPRLVLLTGQDFGSGAAAWREWWGQVGDDPHYVGARRRVSLTAENAIIASLEWGGPDGSIVLRGERTDAPAVDDAHLVYVVGADELVDLVTQLTRFGFMGIPQPSRGLADGRALTLIVGRAVVKSDPALASPVLDRFAARVEAVAADNRWQLYRDLDREPDPTAFWRAERRWLDQDPDPDARAERLKARILGVLDELTGRRRAYALGDLAAIPGLAERMTEADGLALAAAARVSEDWDASTFQMLELALLAPGEKVWRELVDVARERDEAAGQDAVALRRIFALVGSDRVIESLDGPSELVRRVAMDEVASLGDQRATPKLLAVAVDHEEPHGLRRTAVYALGRLRATAARKPLIGMLDQGLVEPDLRRATWIAIARIGGDEVFPVLQRAFPTRDDADRRAIVQALGAMRHPQAARELGNIFALRGGDTLGALALDQLRQQGDALASPALIEHLDDRRQEVRQQCALLLGDFQNPAALPELMVMLSDDAGRLRVVSLIAAITGQDLAGRNDRTEFLHDWTSVNASRPQGVWLIDALGELGVENTLRVEQLQAGAGTSAVLELTRITMEVEQTWIRCLAVRMLRVSAGRDFGTIGPFATDAQRLAICERYRFLHDSAQAASRR